MKEHIPKRHLNFEEPIEGAKSYDLTQDRIYGERPHPNMGTETGTIGAGFNPADNLARVGKKQTLMEADVGTTHNSLILTYQILFFLSNHFSFLFKSDSG